MITFLRVSYLTDAIKVESISRLLDLIRGLDNLSRYNKEPP
jgi:hypothetical protein